MEKKIVVPGDLVSEKAERLEGCVVEGGKTYAATIAVVSDTQFVPLKGQYTPVRGDFIIGIVSEERFSGYLVEVNSPYEGQLSARETREEFDVGDVVSAKILSVNEVHEPTLIEPRKLWGGEIVELEPVKVPRIIGRNGSMLELIKNATKSDVQVGKNGRIYVKGGNTALSTMAILKISRESHTSGLTERIADFLKSEAIA